MLSTSLIEAPAKLVANARALGPACGVVSGADHPVAMESVRQAMEAGLLDPVLVGRGDVIRDLADGAGIDLSGIEIVEADGDAAIAAATASVAGRDDIRMVVKGQVHTDAMMGALLGAEARIRTGSRLTHCFHMTLPGSDDALLITDAAVNIAPNEKTLQAAILNAVGLARAIGMVRPRVALLSATESVLEQMPSSVQADTLAKWAAEAVADADVYGPLAFDNAVSPAAARLKGIEHPVAGHADVLVVPNIETGNALFKMMVYFMGACAAGIVLGGRIPIVLTSRADPPAARLASIALARIQASA